MGAAEVTGACKSHRCRSAIRWLVTAEGRSVPVDLTAERGGPLVPIVVRGARRVRSRRPDDDPERPGFTPHWATCSDPSAWRAERQYANVAGGLAPIGRSRGRDAGPCAGCGWPEHVKYGPDSTGTLCEHCRQVLAGWRALPKVGRGPIAYPVWVPETGERVARVRVSFTPNP